MANTELILDFNISERKFLDEFYNNNKLVLSKITNDFNSIKNIE